MVPKFWVAFLQCARCLLSKNIWVRGLLYDFFLSLDNSGFIYVCQKRISCSGSEKVNIIGTWNLLCQCSHTVTYSKELLHKQFSCTFMYIEGCTHTISCQCYPTLESVKLKIHKILIGQNAANQSFVGSFTQTIPPATCQTKLADQVISLKNGT